MEDCSEDVHFIAKKSRVILTPVADANVGRRWDRTAFGRQLFASSGPIIGSISYGMTLGFTATLFKQLASWDEFHLNEDIESWIASTVVLFMIIGVILCSYSMRRFGRKPTQIGLYIPWIFSWLWVGNASDIWNLLAGCALVGLGAGCHGTVSNIYVGEITDPKFRGLICIQISLGVSFGILLIHVLGLTLPWRIASKVSFLLPLIALLLLLFAPETPIWLLMNNRVETAKKNFFYLRNDSLESETEINAMMYKINNRDTENWRETILSKAFLKPFFILFVMFVVQQGSGLNVISFYAVKIMSLMSGNVNAGSCTVIIDTVRLFATLVACGLIKVTERRRLYFSTAIGVFVSLIGIIVFVIWDLSNIALVAFTCSYIFFLYIGFSPIPWIMMAEVYPANLKEIGACITTILSFIVALAIIKSAPSILANFGMAVMFSIYLTVVVIGVAILYKYLPETNNKTLQQVEEDMKS